MNGMFSLSILYHISFHFLQQSVSLGRRIISLPICFNHEYSFFLFSSVFKPLTFTESNFSLSIFKFQVCLREYDLSRWKLEKKRINRKKGKKYYLRENKNTKRQKNMLGGKTCINLLWWRKNVVREKSHR